MAKGTIYGMAKELNDDLHDAIARQLGLKTYHQKPTKKELVKGFLEELPQYMDEIWFTILAMVNHEPCP